LLLIKKRKEEGRGGPRCKTVTTIQEKGGGKERSKKVSIYPHREMQTQGGGGEEGGRVEVANFESKSLCDITLPREKKGGGKGDNSLLSTCEEINSRKSAKLFEGEGENESTYCVSRGRAELYPKAKGGKTRKILCSPSAVFQGKGGGGYRSIFSSSLISGRNKERGKKGEAERERKNGGRGIQASLIPQEEKG